MLAFASGLNAHDGVVDVPTESFQLYNNACSSERYATQPVATVGYCTTYLVAPRLVVTAGHCMSYAPVGTDASQFHVVFGFQMLDANNARTTVAATEVYTALSVAAVCDGGWDCSVLTLDRPVTNHTILQIRRAGQPSASDSVYVIGHPFLLPLKYDGTAPITGGLASGIFLAAPLDTAGGNSGSPVFSMATNVVEGTLSGTSGSGSLVAFDYTDAGCNVEHVATPADGYTATAQFTTLYASYIPTHCSGDTGGWTACGASGCGICASMLNTAKYDLYLGNHPNCTVDQSCTGSFALCSEACPAPSAADSSNQAQDAGVAQDAAVGDSGAADVGVVTFDASQDSQADTGGTVAASDAGTPVDACHDMDASVAVLDAGPTDSALAADSQSVTTNATEADTGAFGSPRDAGADAGSVAHPVADSATDVNDEVESPVGDAGTDVNDDVAANDQSPVPGGAGCSCSVASPRSSTPGLAGVLLGLSAFLRRRRSR
jgi:MYXO-CTERM domain-containing protein